MKKTLHIAFSALSTTLLAACTVGPNYQAPRVPIAPQWRAKSAAVQSPKQWWQAFNDTTLNQLEDQAAQDNLTIEHALARVDQARAALGDADAAQRPQVQSGASLARSQQTLNSGTGQLSRYVPSLGRTITDGQINISASWDLDFAGGIRRQRETARANVLGAEEGVAAARLSVAAELADSYWALRGAQAQNTKLTELVHLLSAQETIMAVRVHAEAASQQALEESRVRVMVASAALAPIKAHIEAERNRIAALIGQSPSQPFPQLETIGEIGTAPDPALGIPADILRHRPDVMMAEQALIASNAQIGAALAEYYPKVSLSALLGLDSTHLSTLLTGDSVLGQGALGVRWRLFDFGRVDAQVRSARGKERETLAAYRATILRACEEVETSFVQLGAQHERLQHQTDVLRARHILVMTAQRAFAVGGISRDQLIDAQRGVAQAEADVASARQDEARQRGHEHVGG